MYRLNTVYCFIYEKLFFSETDFYFFYEGYCAVMTLFSAS